MKRFIVMSSMLAIAVAPCIGQQRLSPEGKINLRILYPGVPQSDRQKDFVSFLDKHFVAVKSVDFSTFTEQQAEGYNVVILDKDGIQWGGGDDNPLGALARKLPETYKRATLALGTPGAFLYQWMGLKPGYM